METEITPKAELKLETTLEDYTRASLLAARRNGPLRPLPLVVLIAALLLFIGLCSFNYFMAKYYSVFIPFFFCFCCIALLLFFFSILPHSVKRSAEKNFSTYQALMGTVTLKLYADNMITESSILTLTDSYALMAECIETPDLFVIIKDKERLLVLPKRCLPQKQADEITAFLRLVFARRRHFMRNWIF